MALGGTFGAAAPSGMPTLPNLVGPDGAGSSLAGAGLFKMPQAPAPAAPQDWTTQAVQFPPSSLPEPPPPSKIGDMTPLTYSIAHQIAKQQSGKATVEDFMQAAMRGVTPEEHEQQQAQQAQASADLEKTQNAQATAQSIAQDTQHLDDTQFENFLKMYQDELNNVGSPMPVPGNPQNPSLGQGIFAALGALMDPRHAFEIGATPFAANLDKWKQDYATHVAQWQDEGKSHTERLGALHNIIGILNQRTMQAKDLANRKDIATGNNETKLLSVELTASNKAAIARLRGGFGDDKVTKEAFYKGASPEIRQAAREGWARTHNGEDLGEPAPLTPAEKAKLAEVDLKGAQTDLTAAKTDTENQTRQGKVGVLQAQIDNLKSKAHLNDADAEYVAKKTATWDAESQARVAQGWATVRNLNSEVTSRAFGDSIKGKRFAMDQVQQQLDQLMKPTKDALDAIHHQNTDILGQQQILQKQLTGDDEADKPIKAQIKALQDQADANSEHYGKLQKELQDGRKKIHDTAIGELRRQAQAAIAAGHDPAAVKAAYKQASGGEDF